MLKVSISLARTLHNLARLVNLRIHMQRFTDVRCYRFNRSCAHSVTALNLHHLSSIVRAAKRWCTLFRNASSCIAITQGGTGVLSPPPPPPPPPFLSASGETLLSYLTSYGDEHGKKLLVVSDDDAVAEQLHGILHLLLDGYGGNILPSTCDQDLLDPASDEQVACHSCKHYAHIIRYTYMVMVLPTRA